MRQGILQVRFGIVPADQMPTGRVVDLQEREGLVRLNFREHHARRNWCCTMNRYHRHMAGNGLYRQLWGDDRPKPADGEPNPCVASGSFEFASPSEMPGPGPCVPFLDDHRILWVVRRGGITADARDELIAYADEYLGNGLVLLEQD
jgi:hypothetical protein